MSAARLLTLLQGVRKYGAGFRADCPNGHGKVRGSLSIIEADDGRVMLHCFACNDTPGVLHALGLEMADLFPERIKDPSTEARRTAREAFKRQSWAAALGVLSRESGIVLLAARDLLAGKVMLSADVDRLEQAEDRIARAREVLV